MNRFEDRVDVAVIGAGIVGSSVAAHLLRLSPGLRVLLLDRHHVGAGSTSRSTAAFRHQWSVPAHVSFSRYGSGEYDRLESEGFPIRFRRNGYLFLFTDPVEFDRARARVDRQRELGVRGVEVLEPGEIASRVPGGEHVDLRSLAGATWGRADGFLDPLAAAQAYLEEARRAGADYRTSSRVTGVEIGGDGRVEGVRFCSSHSGEEEEDKRIRPGAVVSAAGVWSRSVAGLAGLDLPLTAAKRYLYHTRPLREVDVSRWPMLIGENGAHLRPSEGNTLMMAWENRPRPLSPCPPAETLWTEQDTIDPGFGLGVDEYGVRILGELSRHLPLLAEAVAFSHVTCGWYAVTPDHKAILGEDPRAPGFFHAAGFSGHGVMHAPATGRILAERILGLSPTLISTADLEKHFGVETLRRGAQRSPVEDMVL